MNNSARYVLSNHEQSKLKNNIDMIAPLLDLTGTWTVRDVEADVLDAVKLLRANGAVVCRGRKTVTENRDYRDWPDRDIINEWEWRPQPKEYLQNYRDALSLLPCGHRAHICNPREVDGFSCRRCIDSGEYPTYTRAELERAGIV